MHATDSTPIASTSQVALSLLETSQPRSSHELLTFFSDKELYGIDIHLVQEIRSFETPTRLFTAPADCHGVINLRGAIVPIYDMRMRLGQTQADVTSETAVIVVNLQQGAVGLLVDMVCEVVELPNDAIQPPPNSYTPKDQSHIYGLAQVAQRLLVLIDTERLMSRTAVH